MSLLVFLFLFVFSVFLYIIYNMVLCRMHGEAPAGQ
jgi:hypothetical protein